MTEPTTTPANAGETTVATTTTTATAPDKGTFTQADVDRIVGERATRAGEAANAKLLEALGVKDADELKAKLANLSKMETERLSEAERLAKEVTDAKAETEKERATSQAKVASANDRLRKSAVLTAAQEKFNPEAMDDLWEYIKREKDLYGKLKVTDTDEIEGIADVLKVAEEKKKIFLKPAAAETTATNGTPRTNGARKPAVPPNSDAARDQFARDIKNW